MNAFNLNFNTPDKGHEYNYLIQGNISNNKHYYFNQASNNTVLSKLPYFFKSIQFFKLYLSQYKFYILEPQTNRESVS